MRFSKGIAANFFWRLRLFHLPDSCIRVKILWRNGDKKRSEKKLNLHECSFQEIAYISEGLGLQYLASLASAFGSFSGGPGPWIVGAPPCIMAAMTKIEEILRMKSRPKERQTRLVDAVVSGKIAVKDFIDFFMEASGADKGNCADAMKHISAEKPELLAPHIDVLLKYVNDKVPRVRWGVPEAIGNMARDYPAQVEKAVPYLLKNITDDEKNTTVIKWCAAFALAEIAKFNPGTRTRLLPVFEKRMKEEKNNGVRNVYAKALKAIERQ
jgi:hypothetical protein